MCVVIYPMAKLQVFWKEIWPGDFFYPSKGENTYHTPGPGVLWTGVWTGLSSLRMARVEDSSSSTMVEDMKVQAVQNSEG